MIYVPLVQYPRDGWLWLVEPVCGELLAQGRQVECNETVRELVAAARDRAAAQRPRPLVQACSEEHARYLITAFAAAAAGDPLTADHWSADAQRSAFGAYWRLRLGQGRRSA